MKGRLADQRADFDRIRRQEDLARTSAIRQNDGSVRNIGVWSVPSEGVN